MPITRSRSKNINEKNIKKENHFNDDFSDSDVLSECSSDISEYESNESEINDNDKQYKKCRNKNFSNLNSKKLNKRKKNKDDSENSDIDLECSSDIDDPNDTDYKDSDAYKTFVSHVVDNMQDDIKQKIDDNKRIRFKQCKKKMTKKEIIKFEPEYNKIYDKISNIPDIQDVLKINMPFKSKCELIERLFILDNIQTDTFEYMNLKLYITDELEKYKKLDINNNRIYKNYDDIENELNKHDSEELPLKFKIFDSNMNMSNKIIVYRKYKQLSLMNESSTEHPKLLQWIQTIIDLPHVIKPLKVQNDNIAKFLYEVKQKLDASIYGMKSVKEQILCILNNKLTNPNTTGCSLALAGVQGSGKTKIIQALANAIDIPFSSITLGGATDSSYLQGHGFTYEGSRPGAIVDSLIRMKSINGIIFFDEIDKISNTNYGQEISRCLLHITDFTQNHEFTDKYLGNEIKINLSNMWFIYSLNYVDLIDKTLADRIPIINAEGYNKNQKKELATKYLIPDILKNIGMNKDVISFSDDALEYLIVETDKLYDSDTRDKNGNSGVRKLKDAITNIMTKLNFLKNTTSDLDLELSFTINDFKLPFIIEKDHIENMSILNKNGNSTYIDMYL